MKLGIWAPRGGAADEDDISDAFAFSKAIVMRAEQLGFFTTLIAQRLLGQDLDAWVLAPALAGVTSRIELMLAIHPGVIPPQMAAKMGASLDRICNGRFTANIVNGWWDKELDICGNGARLDRVGERYDRMEEYVRVLKGLWTKDNFSFDGRYYKVDSSPIRFETMRKPSPPLYTASRSDRGKDIIAKYCEWWFCDYDAGFRNYEKNFVGIRGYVADLNNRAASNGRSLQYGVSATVISNADQHEADAQALATEEARLHIREGRSAISALGAGLVGSPRNIADRMKRYEDIGVECFMLRFPQQAEGLERFAQDVMPLIADRIDPIEARAPAAAMA